MTLAVLFYSVSGTGQRSEKKVSLPGEPRCGGGPPPSCWETATAPAAGHRCLLCLATLKELRGKRMSGRHVHW